MQTLYTSPITHYTPTMVQTINNPDGTVSIIHVDPGSALLTLPDGTQAQVRTVSAVSPPSLPPLWTRATARPSSKPIFLRTLARKKGFTSSCL